MSKSTTGSAMEYLRQIKQFAQFSQIFEFRADTVKLDNAVFRLHSQATVMILMVGTMFVSMRQYFGEPIECLSSRTDLPQNLLQHYCWLESTFSVSDGTSKSVGVDVAYPGVKTLNPANGERKVHHKYYQWVYFILILQSIMFYVPKYLWKAKEGKRLSKLIMELRSKHITETSDYDRRRLVQDVIDSLLISKDYFYFFFFCEFLYFINLIAQIWFTNIFLSNQFTKLGIDWLAYNHEQLDNKYDPLIKVFPRMTKCLFHKYGYSGAIERHDALCFLPLNIVNEKIYVVLWFWYVFIFIVTSLCLLQRIVLVLFPCMRYYKLRQLAPSTDKKHLEKLTSTVGNYFILFLLANNMKPYYFKDMIEVVIKEHFDIDSKQNGQPNVLRRAVMNCLNKINVNKTKDHQHKPFSSKKTKKSHNLDIGFTNMNANCQQPPANFVNANREPPTGHADFLNLRNNGW